MKRTQPKWNQLDDQILKSLYPLSSRDQLLKALPGRSINAISQHARKLGITRRRFRDTSNLKCIDGIWFSYLVRPDGYVQISGPTLAPVYKMFEHRYVWEKTKGPIPSGYEIHHIDGNRQNNNINNLECVAESEHHSRDRMVRNSMAKYLKTIGHYDTWLMRFNNGNI